MTVLGRHTPHELKDLIAAKQADLDAINKAYGDKSPEWVQRDSAGFIQFTNDRDSLLKRWDDLKTPSMAVEIGEFFLAGNQDIPSANSEEQYQAVVNWSHDLQKLFWSWPKDMLGDIPGYTVPQPTAPDTDMNVIRSASKVVNPIAKELDKAGIPDPFKAGFSMKPYIIGGGILLGLLAIIAIKR